MEQFGSSYSECKYRETFQEWSAAMETISDGFLRGLKSTIDAEVLQQDWCGHTR